MCWVYYINLVSYDIILNWMSRNFAKVLLLVLIRIVWVGVASIVTCVYASSIFSNASVVVERAISCVSGNYTTSILVRLVASNVGNYSISMDAEGGECKSQISILIWSSDCELYKFYYINIEFIFVRYMWFIIRSAYNLYVLIGSCSKIYWVEMCAS